MALLSIYNIYQKLYKNNEYKVVRIKSKEEIDKIFNKRYTGDGCSEQYSPEINYFYNNLIFVIDCSKKCSYDYKTINKYSSPLYIDTDYWYLDEENIKEDLTNNLKYNEYWIKYKNGDTPRKIYLPIGPGILYKNEFNGDILLEDIEFILDHTKINNFRCMSCFEWKTEYEEKNKILFKRKKIKLNQNN